MLAMGDPLCDLVLGSDTESLNQLIRESDYILCSAPLTEETRGLIGKAQFEHAKKERNRMSSRN